MHLRIALFEGIPYNLIKCRGRAFSGILQPYHSRKFESTCIYNAHKSEEGSQKYFGLSAFI